MKSVLSVVFAILVSWPASAQSLAPLLLPSAGSSVERTSAPLSVATDARVAPVATMLPAEVGSRDELEKARAWNGAGRSPLQIGIVRPLAAPVTVDLRGAEVVGSTATDHLLQHFDHTTRWAAKVEVAGAPRLRLHLSNIELPAGTRFWVTSASGASVGPFGQELAADDGLWTPSVDGEVIGLEVEVPKEEGVPAPGFEIDRIGQFLPEAFGSMAVIAGEENTSCITDARCIGSGQLPVIANYRKAVAMLLFEKNGGLYVCSGALLNNTNQDGTPYLLTANHCIDQSGSAASLEAFWDYTTSSCQGNFPNLDALPRTSGAQLLSTSASSDFSLLRLSNRPAGRFLLGWNANPSAVAPGTTLYRISHPSFPDNSGVSPQVYSVTSVTSHYVVCNGEASLNLVRSQKVIGDVRHGSSGAPAILANGQVVGQLLGVCPGLDGAATCTNQNVVVDGAFWSTFPWIQDYLAPQTSPTEPCVEDETTACLLDGRFRAEVHYRSTFNEGPADRTAFRKPVTGFASSNYETAFFYFNSVNNIEILLKMLDQGNENSSGQPTIAVLTGVATPLHVEVVLTDTTTGASRTYTSAYQSMAGKTDFHAFVK